MWYAVVGGIHARLLRSQPQLLRSRGVAPDLKDVEVLTRKDVPIAFEKRAPQMLRQRLERAAVLRIVGVNRIIVDPRANEFVVARVVQIRALEARRRNVIHP